MLDNLGRLSLPRETPLLFDDRVENAEGVFVAFVAGAADHLCMR